MRHTSAISRKCPAADHRPRQSCREILLPRYCWPVGFEVAPIGVGAVPAAPLPAILLLVKDCVAPLIAVVLKEISLLDSRMVVVPPPFWTPHTERLDAMDLLLPT